MVASVQEIAEVVPADQLSNHQVDDIQLGSTFREQNLIRSLQPLLQDDILQKVEQQPGFTSPKFDQHRLQSQGSQ